MISKKFRCVVDLCKFGRAGRRSTWKEDVRSGQGIFKNIFKDRREFLIGIYLKREILQMLMHVKYNLFISKLSMSVFLYDIF